MPRAATSNIDQNKVVKLVKAGKNQKQVADELGVTVGQLGMTRFNLAQVEAGQYSKIPATAASAKKARNEGNRWELIGARMGVSPSKARELFESAGGDASVGLVGKGGRPKSKASSNGVQVVAKGKGKAAAGPVRNRTRAQKAKAGNPS